MNLPALGPTNLWAARAKLRANPLRECADLVSALVVVYQQLVQSKCAGVRPEQIRAIADTQSAARVYGQLHASALRCLALAPRTKAAMWATDRVLAHACNVLWTLQYWTLQHAAPDPLSGNFGFATVKNLVCFAACAAAPASRAKPAAPAAPAGRAEPAAQY